MDDYTQLDLLDELNVSLRCCANCKASRKRIWEIFKPNKKELPVNMIQSTKNPNLFFEVRCFFFRVPVNNPLDLVFCDAYEDKDDAGNYEE